MDMLKQDPPAPLEVPFPPSTPPQKTELDAELPQPISIILSIGTATDKALDELKLPDWWILSLREIIRTTRNTHWTHTLVERGLMEDQAKYLVKAVTSDLIPAHGTKVCIRIFNFSV